ALACHIRRLTRQGRNEGNSEMVAVAEGHVAIQPQGEGIHVVRLRSAGSAGSEARFLAITPPQPIDEAALRAALPRAADKLLKREEVTIVAMGDSVLWTGEFPEMLAMMLRRASGNEKITVIKRAHPGRSIDATVRTFEKEIAPLKADIGLMMYGLNDQAAATPLIVYLQQHRWVADHLRETDLVFMKPTPDLDPNHPPAYALRTVGFGAALAELCEELNIPLVDAFSAVWGDGAADLKSAHKALWPLFPTSYSKPFTTLLETEGKGDTIHPNALGHLAIARAVYDRIAAP